jgi:hypothetical protein
MPPLGGWPYPALTTFVAVCIVIVTLLSYNEPPNDRRHVTRMLDQVFGTAHRPESADNWVSNDKTGTRETPEANPLNASRSARDDRDSELGGRSRSSPVGGPHGWDAPRPVPRPGLLRRLAPVSGDVRSNS